MSERGKCPVCREDHDCKPLSDGESAMINLAYEPGTDEAHVYYRMAEHHNPATGKPCDGTGKVPDSLAEHDWDGWPDDDMSLIR